MTISTTTSEIAYDGNGITTVFPIPFRFLTNADIVVVGVSSAGISTTKVFTTDYTLTGAGAEAGGTVTMLVAPASDTRLIIYRDTAIVQETDYISGDPFPAETHERALDRLTMIAQEIIPRSTRSIRVPVGDSASLNPTLPAAMDRLGRLIAFNSTTGATELSSFTQTQLASAVAAAYAAGSTADAVTFLQAGTGAVARSVQAKLREYVSVLDFDADPTGVADSSAAFQAAYDTGKAVWIPAGTYLLNTGIDCTTSSSSTFTPGPRFIGEGMSLVTINTSVNGPAFNVTTDTTLKFQLGGEFSGFKLQKTGSPAASIGIQLRRAYNFLIEDVWIYGMSADGIKVIMTEGDADGSNMLELRRVRLDTCAGWGFNVAVTGAYNEFSFLDMEHVFIQQCGTASASTPPPSGGMNWKGQLAQLRNCGFAINENVALYLPGGGGLSNGFYMDSVAIENNKKRGIYCTGISMFRARNLQLYNNDTYTATSGVEFDASSYSVRNIELDGVLVRATVANNAYTAFKISGGNAVLESCRVRRVTWDTFDYAGQTRFNGWQFDHVEQGCVLVAVDATTLTLRPEATRRVKGNKTPHRLRGGAGGTPSTSGEIIDLEVATTGISISNSGLANSTRYYCYLFDDSGVPTLELSTTGFVTSSLGVSVKSSDATRVYVGSVETDGSAQFKLTAGGWLNPMWVPASQVGVLNATWCDSTGDLRVKTDGSAPTSDTDGVIVGTQS